MTAVVKVDLATQYFAFASDFVLTDKDVLAAFIDETCTAVASPQDGLFFLYITGKEGAVTLRYYSAHYKNIFETKTPFQFKNDDILGTADKPFVPAFVVK